MTSVQAFTQEDFDVFDIDGLDARMEAIKASIRPKLVAAGESLTPLLSINTGDEMVYHVAKHARRTVNPPKDTWVAWANDKRGYKKHPHFQLGLWGSHLFLWYAVIYEAEGKVQIGQALERSIDELLQLVPDHFHWSADHTVPASTAQKELGRDGVLTLIKRLQDVKKAELLCGVRIDRHDPILTDERALATKIEETFKILSHVYTLARPRTVELAR